MCSVETQTAQEDKDKKKQGRFEFNFPILIFRTKIFTGVFNKLGRFRASKLISWLALAIVPVVASIGLYLLVNSLITMFWAPASREIIQELGPGAFLLLPGINPLLPLFYGWLAIICAITIHEGAHGIVARNLDLEVKSSGLLFLLFIPIGAFVDVDEEQIAKAKPKNSLRVMAAGVGGNIIVAVVCILSVLVIVNGLTPVVDGVYIFDVVEGMPADEAGLLPRDVFVSVNDLEISSFEDLQLLLETKNPGDEISLTVARGEMWKDNFSTTLQLVEDDGRAVMGVSLGELTTEERLNFYQNVTPATLPIYLIPPALAPGLVPFSDSASLFYTHALGAQWQIWANLFFWLWFVNVNVAVFNALPIYPLDGGRMFHIVLKGTFGQKAREKTIFKLTMVVTAILITIILLLVLIPFIL
jgi:membrane-associated protease RseP (regulator of RpoE activity)